MGSEEINGVVQAFCEYSTRLRIFDQPLLWNQVSSCKGSVATAKYTENNCEARGKEVVIGFALDDDRFVTQITLCFDNHNQTTLYTKYDLVPWKSSFNIKPRFMIEDKGFFNVGSKAVFEWYNRGSQRKTINNLLDLNESSKKYINDGAHFLSRGHIAAAADFYYPSQINATYRYINMAPQWQSINGGNWNQAEVDSRNYANRRNVTLKVWSGTFGVATLPNNKTKTDTGLYLYVNGAVRGLPVPALFWKMLYEPDSKKGVVLIVLNNPYIDNDSKHIICTDISVQVSWLNWNKTIIENGYSYACSVPDFKKVVDYAPNIELVNGLLI